MVEHQNNCSRIEELKRQNETLDNEIRTRLCGLVDARKALVSIRPHTAGSSVSAVDVNELLAYAKFIHATTIPTVSSKQSESNAGADARIANGMATPSPGAQDADAAAAAGGSNVAIEAIDEEGKKFIEPQAHLPLSAWPSYEALQAGVLGDIQRMIESGRDPASVLSKAEQAEVDRKKEEVEAQERIAEQERERRRMSMFDIGRRTNNNGGSDVFNPDD